MQARCPSADSERPKSGYLVEPDLLTSMVCFFGSLNPISRLGRRRRAGMNYRQERAVISERSTNGAKRRDYTERQGQ